jgi:uncharacterized membrane protein
MNASSETTTSAAQRTLREGNGADADDEFAGFDDDTTDYGAGARARARTQGLDQALACVSIGLGLIEVLAPRRFGRLIGAGEHPTLMRLCGLREIASGVGLLSPRTSANAAASRLAGDALDFALLGAAFASPDARRTRLTLAATTVLGVAAIDAYAARRHAGSARMRAGEEMPVSVSLAINSTPEKLYAFWRDFENLPRFMEHLEAVTRIDDRTSRWVAKGPAGTRVQWEAEVVEDRPSELITWRTRPDSDIQHRGAVSFERASDGRGCIVHVELVYAAPGGIAGAALAKALGEEPDLQIRRDLRALKQLLETGEVATTRGQPTGRRSIFGKAFTGRAS